MMLGIFPPTLTSNRFSLNKDTVHLYIKSLAEGGKVSFSGFSYQAKKTSERLLTRS